MAQTGSLPASPRQATGKGGARQARFRGKVPAVIYGHGREAQPLELEAKALEKALHGVEPASTIIELSVDGKTDKHLIREIQRHPIRPDIIHVDFFEIHASEKRSEERRVGKEWRAWWLRKHIKEKMTCATI